MAMEGCSRFICKGHGKTGKGRRDFDDRGAFFIFVSGSARRNARLQSEAAAEKESSYDKTSELASEIVKN